MTWQGQFVRIAEQEVRDLRIARTLGERRIHEGVNGGGGTGRTVETRRDQVGRGEHTAGSIAGTPCRS